MAKKKTLSERIGDRAESGEKSSKGALNRAAFLSLREEIKGAHRDGWAVKKIWETLDAEKKISFSYQTFRNYFNQLIVDESNARVDTTTTETKSDIKKTPMKKASIKPSTPAGFTFNNHENKEDLI